MAVRLSTELLADLEAEAARADIPRNDLVIKLLREGLIRRGKIKVDHNVPQKGPDR